MLMVVHGEEELFHKFNLVLLGPVLEVVQAHAPATQNRPFQKHRGSTAYRYLPIASSGSALKECLVKYHNLHTVGTVPLYLPAPKPFGKVRKYRTENK